MPAFGLQFRELLPYGVEQELDQLVAALNGFVDQNHDGDSGDHTDILADSLAARSGPLDVSSNVRFLKGRFLFDELGNQSHVAGLRPLQWTADVHNYNPPGIDTAFLVECDTDADRSITGLERGDRQKQLLIFGNRGNYNITLEHNHASSLYSNRFGLPGNTDIVLGSAEYIWLYYDVGSEIWRAVSVL